MAIKIAGNSKEWENHPETDSFVRAVVCDVTDPVEKETKFGKKIQLRIVYQSELKNSEDKPFCVWSRPMTATLGSESKPSNLKKEIEAIIGKPIGPEELEALSDENVGLDGLLIGKPVRMLVEHADVDGKTFANVGKLRPYNGDDPLKVAPDFVRAKDRKEKEGEAATYQKAGGDKEPERNDWATTKVHVPPYGGMPLSDLSSEDLNEVYESWVRPRIKDKEMKLSADDKRLLAAFNKLIEEYPDMIADAEIPF